MSTGQFRNKIQTQITSNDNKEISASKLRDVLQESADSIDTVYDLATDPTKLNQMQELLDLTLDAKNDAEQAKADAILVQNPLGEYNASTNLPALNATPVAGVNGSFYSIVTAGTVGFAGSNFASGASLAVGGRLVKKSSTQWYYQPPSDLAMTKVVALEGLAATSQEIVVPKITLQFFDNEGNVILAFYDDGTTYPPYPEKDIPKYLLSQQVLDYIEENKYTEIVNPYIISGIIDADGYLLNCICSDGYPYPPVLTTEQAMVEFQDDLYFPDGYDYLQGENVIQNAIYGHWSYPIGVYHEGCLFVGGIGEGKYGNKGEVTLSVKRDNGLIRSRIMGNVRTLALDGNTDDHNVPIIRIDKREGAIPKLMSFQAEHNTHPTRVWKQPTLNIDKWNIGYSTFGANNSYTQLNENGANPDEMLIFSRLDSAIPRSWRAAWTTNNAGTFIEKPLFAGDGWMYMYAVSNDDKTKLNISFYAHPLNSTDSRIFAMVLDWETGAIYAPGNLANPIIADFRAAMLDSSFVPVDPRIGGLLLVDPINDLQTKLWDIGTSVTGECLVTYTEFPDGKSMASFRAARHKVVSFDIVTGVVNYTLDLGEAGMPIDRRQDVENWDYYGGSGIIDSKTICLATYKSDSFINNGNNVEGNGGYTSFILADISNIANVKYKEIRRFNGKGRKPVKVANSAYLLIVECKRFTTFKDFESTIRIINLKEI